MFSQNCGASLAQPHNSSSKSDIPLLTTCPGCRRKNVHLRVIRIKKKSRPALRVVKRSFGDNYYEEKITVKKKLNPAKACNLFIISDAGPIKNPVLSLPQLKREDIGANIRLAIDIQRKYMRFQYLPSEIALSVFDKYPSVREKIAPIFPLIMKGYEVLEEVRESAANDQTERSLIDWIPICDIADKGGGYHAASSKYYAITPDGKKKYLSPKHIKTKIPQIQDFILRYKKYVRFYIFFAQYMLKIAENDPKLSQELKEIELRYMREFIPDLLRMFRNKLIEVQGDTKGTLNNKTLNTDKEDYNNNDYYEYVESRYFDEKTYEEEKTKVKQDKRKSHPDGWKTCCILKPNELPIKTLEELRRH
jgi:hypothetical protein